MQLALLQIMFILMLIYFFGEFFVKILANIRLLDNTYNTLAIKFLISLMIINVLVINGFNLKNISKFTFIVSFIYLIYFIHQKIKNNNKNKILFDVPYLFIFVTLFFFLIKIIIEPVQLWDARSIWFYSGKIIYFNENYLFENFQNDFCNKCDYLLYPKLIPSLTAYIATIFGFWNDYVTKLSLFLLLIPAIFYLKDEFNNFLNFLLSLVLLIFSMGFFIWNGYADGYLAIYTSLSYLSLLRFIQTKKNYYFFVFFLTLSIIINLKIESIFFCFSIILFLFTIKNLSLLKKIFQKENIFILVLIFLPIMIWWIDTIFNFIQIESSPNIFKFNFFEYIKILFSDRTVLGARFNNYFTFVLSFVFLESKIIFTFILQFLIIFYARLVKLESKKIFNLFYLNIVPLIYTMIIIMFYFYIGYSRSLDSMENFIIASFDRLSLTVKSLFAINILLLITSYKFRSTN